MKKLLFLLSLCALLIPAVLDAQISTSWTSNMPSRKIPSGVTLNDTDTLTGYNVIKTVVDLDATTYDNANKATAFNAAGAALKTYIDHTKKYMGIDSTGDNVAVYVITNTDRVFNNYKHPDPIEQWGVAEDVYRFWVTIKYKLAE